MFGVVFLVFVDVKNLVGHSEMRRMEHRSEYCGSKIIRVFYPKEEPYKNRRFVKRPITVRTNIRTT